MKTKKCARCNALISLRRKYCAPCGDEVRSEQLRDQQKSK